MIDPYIYQKGFIFKDCASKKLVCNLYLLHRYKPCRIRLNLRKHQFILSFIQRRKAVLLLKFTILSFLASYFPLLRRHAVKHT